LCNQRGSLLREHDERGLKSILHVSRIRQCPAANAQHHEPVPLHQGRKRRLIASTEKLLQQLSVAPLGRIMRYPQPIKE
jgi:hypothetical protein